MAKEKTKICKYCKTEIPKDAKICPNCRKKQKGGFLKWIIIAIVLLVIISIISGGGDDDTKKVGEVGSETTSETSSEDSSSQEATQDIYHVGDILEDGNLQIVYMSSGTHVEDNEYLQPAEGKKYIFAQFAFINTSDSSDASVSFYSFEAYADGYNAEAYYGGEDNLSATLSAGRQTSGYLYFEVPEDAQDIEIEYTPNYLTNDKITFAFEGDADSGYTLETDTTATEGALKIGESSESSQLKVTYLSCYRDNSDNMFITPKDGYHYVTCEFEFENLSSSDQNVSFYDFDCFADGVSCDAAYFRDDNLSATMSAGRKASSTVTFEVPDNATTVEVEYLSNYWTSKRVVFTVDEQ